MRFIFLFVILLLGCGTPTPSLNGFVLGSKEGQWNITVSGDTLLDSLPKDKADGQFAALTTRTSKANIEMKYGTFKFTDAKPGSTNSTDFSRGTVLEWKATSPQKATGIFKDEKGNAVANVEATSTALGELAIKFTAADEKTNRMSLSFSCADSDHFLGFGAQADGVDHKGHTVPIFTSEPGIGKRMSDDEYPDIWFLEGTRHASSYGLPTWVSNRGYIGVVESDARSVFEICSTRSDVFRIEVWDNQFTLWIFEGSPARALSRASARVLGRPMTPPAIAFAPWNDAIYGPVEVKKTAKLLRDNHIPSSAIWTEDFRGGNQMGDSYRLVEDWDLDSNLYPDAGTLAKELLDDGFSWQAYFNTFLVEGNPVDDLALRDGHFVKDKNQMPYRFSGVTFKPTGLADLSKPEAREFVKSYLRQARDIGFSGWMADYGEWLPHDAVLASGEDAMKAHNRYAGEWAKLNSEVIGEKSDGVQRLFFSRAGWFKSNEVTPVVWAGDQRTDFQPDDGMPTVVPLGINLGLSAVSTFGHDIAGYQSATNPAATKEVFFRWVTLGALTPVMRTHHGTNPKQSWRMDSDAETLAHYKRWAIFHTSLFPYFAAYAVEANATGIPIMRAMALAFPTDENAWTNSTQYMLGSSLLVAPVTTAGATKRDVHFPAGDWVSFDGKQKFTGPVDASVDAPLTEIPIFAKVGSIVPRIHESVETFAKAKLPTVDLFSKKDYRKITVFPGAPSEFVEVDGTRYSLFASSLSAFADNNVAMPECSSPMARGCVDSSGMHKVLRLKASGPVEFPNGSLTISGAARTVDIELVQ
jgi:sulfoquinovosidase